MARKRYEVLTDETYEKIKSLIMDHILSPGERVSIDGLSRSFQISQTPIREALARLESDELVTRRPLSGYSVSEILTLEELKSLYEFRMQIEPKAAELACKNMNDERSDLINNEVAKIADLSTGNTYFKYKDMFQHDIRFHNLIFNLAGNKFLTTAFEKAHCHLHIFRMNPTSKKLQGEALQEHFEIAKALLVGNPLKAKNAMTFHLRNSHHRLLKNPKGKNDSST